MDNLAMVLGTCDAYSDTWNPFFQSLDKHWKNFNLPVYLGAESLIFDYLRYDIRCPLANGKRYDAWSKRLLKLLQNVETEFILFMLDDFWLTDDVDQAEFETAVNIIQSNADIGYICLYADKSNNGKFVRPQWLEDSEFDNLYEATPQCPYRLTTQVGLWNVNYLKKVLRSHESAWIFEGRGNWRANMYLRKYRVFDSKSRIVSYPNGGVVWGGKCHPQYLRLYPSSLYAECLNKRGLYDDRGIYCTPRVPKNLKTYWQKLLSILPFQII